MTYDNKNKLSKFKYAIKTTIHVKSVPHPISTLDQYQSSDLQPSDLYWSLRLIYDVIQILPYMYFLLYSKYTSMKKKNVSFLSSIVVELTTTWTL